MTYHIIRTLWKLMSLLPMGILHLLSNLIYFPLYYIARYRRKVVRKNLVNAFPEKTEKEIKKIEKDFYNEYNKMSVAQYAERAKAKASK